MHGARYRVIIDNDFSGDPDGLVQLAHHLLSPSVDVRLVIGSHLRPLPGMDATRALPESAVAKAAEVTRLAGREDVALMAGANGPMTDRGAPAESAGAAAIIEEAMRDDDRPLFACLGGSLTALATAWLLEPGIADRLTAVWIGGVEHPGLAEPPPVDSPAFLPTEFNTFLDVAAVQTVLNDSDIPLWQVPRDAYRQMIASIAELEMNLASAGPLGAHLFSELLSADEEVSKMGVATGETFGLGDSPLVLLTALQTTFEPHPASSSSTLIRPPAIGTDGNYRTDESARSEVVRTADIRVFTTLDSALTIRDLYAKVQRRARTERRRNSARQYVISGRAD